MSEEDAVDTETGFTASTNVQHMLSGLTSDAWSIIFNRDSTTKSGLALIGISVLKILEYIVLDPDLKCKIQTIFKYPRSAGFLDLKAYILSRIRNTFFSHLNKYIEVNQSEIEAHLEAFAIAINKQHLLDSLKIAVKIAAGRNRFRKHR